MHQHHCMQAPILPVKTSLSLAAAKPSKVFSTVCLSEGGHQRFRIQQVRNAQEGASSTMPMHISCVRQSAEELRSTCVVSNTIAACMSLPSGCAAAG